MAGITLETAKRHLVAWLEAELAVTNAWEAALVHGDLVEITLFGFLGEALSNSIPGLGHLIYYKISRADCDFSIEKGYVRTSNFAAQGSNMHEMAINVGSARFPVIPSPCIS